MQKQWRWLTWLKTTLEDLSNTKKKDVVIEKKAPEYIVFYYFTLGFKLFALRRGVSHKDSNDPLGGTLRVPVCRLLWQGGHCYLKVAPYVLAHF